MKVKLSIGEVEIIDHITWGIQEEIRATMFGGVKITNPSDLEKQKLELDPSIMLVAKYKTLELAVKKITLNDGTDVPYSKEWMNALSPEDGDTLYDAVDKITNAKKK